MEFDNEFYKQWKTKATTSDQLFRDLTDFSKEKIVDEKIFSSTLVDKHQIDSQTFSLRLSTESYIDETQENLESQANEVIVLSDTSSDYSIFPVQDIPISASEKVNELLKTLARQQSKASRDSNSKESKVIIDESDSEIEERKIPKIIKDTVVESATLSERKKRDILQWLSANLENSRCGSSCSQESVIADSRKSGLSSGNSSLERFELMFETPNNRGKLLKPHGTLEGSNRSNENLERQNTIDQYLNICKKKQFNTVKDKTPVSKKSDNTPVSVVKTISRRVIIPEAESPLSETPRSQKSDKTPVNNINAKSRRMLIPESESIDSKTPSSQKSNNTPSNNINIKSRRVLIPESKSFDSKTPSSQKSNNTPSNNINIKSKRVLIPESQSFDSKTPSSQKSNNTPSNNINTKPRRVIISESESIETTPSSENAIRTPVTNEKIGQQDTFKAIIIPESLENSDDIVSLDISYDMNLNNNKNEEKSNTNKNTANDISMNEYEDILENLYGATWRNKASTLICATEPRKQTTKKLVKDAQTEKKLTFRNPRFVIDSDSELSDKGKNCIAKKKQSQTTSNKNRIRSRLNNDFINDDSTSESSPDCSYYTATSNPPQNNFNSAITDTVKRNNNNFKKILSICDSDSESEVENDKWKTKNNQRKLSFDCSSSSTSEFDPEDVVPPKSRSKNVKVTKPLNCHSVKTRTALQAQKQPVKRSFLASLSKDVPLDQADFKAMTYRVKYSALREELCKVLYNLYNEKVFDNQLPTHMPIEWSTRLRGTAGKCYNKQSLKALGKTVRSSRLVLATKILDSPDRLRDTLIHELCHAATWLINNVSDGHGSFWKAWAAKAIKVFPELPSISRCHNYDIQTKYTYKCVNCHYSIGRHSKSLDLKRKRCGYCHGEFELLINKVTKDGKVQKKSTAQAKEPTGFALYVKENYHSVKQNGDKIKHGDIMKILGQQFSAVKLTPKAEDRRKNNEDELP